MTAQAFDQKDQAAPDPRCRHERILCAFPGGVGQKMLRAGGTCAVWIGFACTPPGKDREQERM